MNTAILAEDEALLRDELREALAALWPELQILAEVGDGASAVRAIAGHKPDVAFLDINMPQLSGLEVAQAVRGQTAVVFLTAYNQHALQAFDLGAVDYLVKPLSKARLMETIQRLKSRGAAPVPEQVFQALGAPKYLRWVQASVGSALRLITTEEIHYFQSDAKYTRVVTGQGEALIRRPIKELAEALNPDDFVQISRGAIVNLRCIDSVLREPGHMEVRLRNSTLRLTVTATYQASFKQM